MDLFLPGRWRSRRSTQTRDIDHEPLLLLGKQPLGLAQNLIQDATDGIVFCHDGIVLYRIRVRRRIDRSGTDE